MKSVRCIDLCKTYRQGEVEVTGLDHVNLEIEEGGGVCLSAPSGGGKTTLLNAIGGLDTPDSGERGLAGNLCDNRSKGELAKRRLHNIGFGFRYDTPLGPLRVDWGFKIDLRPDEPRSRIHVSLGHAF